MQCIDNCFAADLAKGKWSLSRIQSLRRKSSSLIAEYCMKKKDKCFRTFIFSLIIEMSSGVYSLIIEYDSYSYRPFLKGNITSEF